MSRIPEFDADPLDQSHERCGRKWPRQPVLVVTHRRVTAAGIAIQGCALCSPDLGFAKVVGGVTTLAIGAK